MAASHSFFRNVLFSAAATVLATGVAMAQANTYTIDKAHSEADFAIKHMAVSTVHGSFRGVSGSVIYDAADVTKSSVNAVIDVTTVDTGVPMRDTHLKSPDFFDTAKFSTMTFKSTSVKQDGSSLDVMGDLTLHGVTKPVTLKVDVSKEEPGMKGGSVRGFEATTTINRKDFGLTWNGTLKSGDSVLGDDVKIDISIEGDRQ